MKITTEHYEQMKTAIASLDREAVNKHAEAVLSEGKFKDYGKRMRWDLLHASKLSSRSADNFNFVCDVLYKYANDEHIDTALKNIVRELGYQFEIVTATN